jgi:hypothetical protein
MSEWLLDRLYSQTEQPTARFAFQGTINWMKALSLSVRDKFSFDQVNDFYSNVPRKQVNYEYDTRALEFLLLSIHNISSIYENKQAQSKYNICRSAIISWYYSIYFSSKAMISANCNSIQESHSETSSVWQKQLIDNSLVMIPFNLNLNTLVKSETKKQISVLCKNKPIDLNNYPNNEEESLSCLLAYLSGTSDFEREKYEEIIKSSNEYKKCGFDSFRKKAARELRDKILAKHCVNFLVQAFRYRGKSNYRDSIYLSYGDDNTEKINELIDNLYNVSVAFYRMASIYVSKRIEKGIWPFFIKDLKSNLRITINLDELHS